MNLPRRVAWNTIAQAAGRAVTLALSLVTTVLLTRHLGVSGYGVYVTVTVFVPFFALFFDAGVTTFVVRGLSTDETRTDLFREALGLRLSLALPAMLLAFGIALLVYGGSDGETTRTAVAVGLPLILTLSVASAVTALFQARLQMDRAALAEVVGQATAVGLVVLAVATDGSINAIVAAAVVGSLVNTTLLLLLARRMAPVRPLFRLSSWMSLLRQALPLGLALMIAAVYFRADAVLLSVMKGSDAVGIYGVAYRLLEAVVAFPGFFYVSIFPLFAQAAARRDLANLRDVTQRAFDLLTVAAVPVVAGTTMLAPELVRALAGSGFEATVTPLRIVIVGGGLMFINGLFSYLLIAVGRQTTLLWVGLATLALNLGLNVALIPAYSYTAAAAVATGSEALGLLTLFVLVWRAVRFAPQLTVTAKAALAGSLMVVCLAFTPSNLALMITVGVCVYAAALLLLRTHVSLELRELLGAGR
jgi:O-antigen/teichoic acid export membrane protein